MPRASGGHGRDGQPVHAQPVRQQAARGINFELIARPGPFLQCAARRVASPNGETAMPKSSSSRSDRQIQVRQITHVQASWTEEERGAPGAFTLQLILDNGAAEYVLRPTAEDADVLVKLFARSANATFDVERKVVMFGNLAVK